MTSAVGIITVILAVFFWGTNFVPVKEFPTGDGLFFQWVMCTAIWMSGLVVHLVRQSTFEPLMLLGGIAWATGNVMSVPIIRLLGMGVGGILWGSSCLIMGWASGRFGLFGLKPQPVNNTALNTIGIFVCILSSATFLFIKPNIENPANKSVEQGEPLSTVSSPEDHHDNHVDGEHDHHTILLTENKLRQSLNIDKSSLRYRVLHFLHMENQLPHAMMHFFHLDAMGVVPSKSKNPRHCFPVTMADIDHMNPSVKRALGTVMALISGGLYGINFNPAQYLMDHREGTNRSDNALDYVFAHFCGIYMASTVYFLIYCILKRNKPQIFPQVVLPGYASGLMWSIAQISFFVANQNLGMVVVFPLTSSGPGLVSALWSVFLFKEISGRRNILILILAFSLSGIAVLFITLSKII